jgi:hypothetical protein
LTGKASYDNFEYGRKCRKSAVFSASFGSKNTVISGFNTDVEFDRVVYHVQTEDKGVKARLIVTLVYDGGTILASKRVSYDDLLSGEFDEDLLAEGVQRQHQLICAAVKAGRMGDLKDMTAKSRGKNASAKTEVPAEVAEMPQVSVAASAEMQNTVVAQPPTALVENPVLEVPVLPIRKELDEPHFTGTPNIFADAPFVDGVSVIEDEEILPAEAVAVVSELSGVERPTNTKLGIELLGDSKFRGGDRRTVSFMVCRGTERKVVHDAEIMIKVLGSSFRPVIFHAKSDANGLAKVHMQLPHFEAGRAALLVRAMNNGEEVELRRIVTPG